MSNYKFLCRWIAPNGGTSDITDRVFFDQMGSLNRGVAAPDELQAFVAGDLTLVANNHDGFFTAFLKSNVTDPTTLRTYQDYIQVDIERDGVRMFRGVLLPSKIELNNFDRTASMTVLGPMRLCDNTNAETYQRAFPANLQTASNALAGDTQIQLNTSVGVPLTTGDVLSLGTADSVLVTVKAWSASTTPFPVVVLSEPLKDPVGSGVLVTVTTPYYRNQDIATLAVTLFALAGVPVQDVRFTGLVGARSFVSAFNTNGAYDSGTITSIQRLLISAGGAETLLLNTVRASSLTESWLTAASVTSGFVVNSSFTVPLPSVTHNWAEQGGDFLSADVAGTFFTQFSRPYDYLTIDAGLLSAVYTTKRSSFAMVKTVGLQVYLYEIFFQQSVRDETYPEYSGAPDYEQGGDSMDVALRRYTTVDAGINWTLDTTFVPSRPAPTFVTYTGNAKTYSYVVVGYNTAPAVPVPVGVTAIGTTNTGPNTLGGGSQRITVNWAAMAGATIYKVYRTADYHPIPPFGLGQIGPFVAGLTLDDTGFVASTTDVVPETAGRLRLYSIDQAATNKLGALPYELSISAQPYLTGAGYDHVLYYDCFAGSNGTIAPFTPQLNMERMRINGASPVSRNVIHFNAKSGRAIMTRKYGSYTNVNRKVDLYWWDLSSAAPGIVHTSDDGFVESGASSILGIPGLVPQLRTLHWNQIDGPGSRVAMLFSNRSSDSGTGLITLTPGTASFAGTPEGRFTVEETVLLAPNKILALDVFGATGAGVLGRRQVTNENSGSVEFAPAGTLGAYLTPWNVSIGGVGTVNVWTVFTPWGFWTVSRYHTGFISYADFSGMSVSKALQELAFVVNAGVMVDWTAGASPVPFGSFVSRDLPPPGPIKLLANLNGTRPAGAVQDSILRQTYRRAWEQTYPYVTVTGSPDTIIGESGVDGAKQIGLEVTARFVDTTSFADVIADSLFAFYGPSYGPMAEPLIVPTAFGIVRYAYTVVANNLTTDPRVGIVAYSDEGVVTNSSSPLTGGSPNALTIAAVSGSTVFHVFRTKSTAPGGNSSLLGYLGFTLTNSFSDIGAAPDPSKPLPSRLMQPRQSAAIEIIDDGTKYAARDEVQFPDLLGHTDLGDPNRLPPAPPSTSLPPRWWIENIDFSPVEPIIRLEVVEKDVPA